MTGRTIRMLLVGDASSAFRTAAEMARAAGAEVTMADTSDEALALLRDRGAALVMIDVLLDVPAFLADLAAERFAVPVLACGIDAPAARAVAAIRAGARDYVPLPPDPELIAAAIGEIATLPDQPLIGEDPAFRRALAFAQAMGPASAPILITGEKGTGKERVARAVHVAACGSGSFTAVECAGVTADILESELFGHAAGAFPGARAARRGAFTAGHGGTVFLRDVDCLPPMLQVRLLAALDERHTPRLVAGTTRDLVTLVEAGRFRADLLDRLALATVHLPPLRARGSDVIRLAEAFARRFARRHVGATPALTPAAEALLAGYGWPGNIRELEETMHRAVLLTGVSSRLDIDAIVLADGSRIELTAEQSAPAVEPLVGLTVEEVERELILQTLERCHGNRTSASQILGISVRTMRNKLKAFVEAGIPVAPAI
ncbi:MAG: sigma-54-dependent transcriptional regulator [Sphingomonas sp.]